jgi:HK97 family phage major capsid protein
MEFTLEQLRKFVQDEVQPLVSDNQKKFSEELRAEREDFRKVNQEWIKELLGGMQLQREQEKKDSKIEKGVRASRIIRCLVAAKGDPQRGAAFAEKIFGDTVIAKALAATTDTAGGFLIAEEVARDVIELLRPASVVRSMNPITVPLNGNTLRLPRLNSGSQGGWIGENQNIPKTEPVFGSITLSPKKYASLVPISNDLLRRADQSVDVMVRDDMVADIGQSTDIAYIRGTGAGGQPLGFRNISGIQTTATAGTTLAQVTTDLGTAMQKMMDKNIRMLRLGWLMEPRTWRHLITIRDGNGNLVFKPEMDRNMLFGFPFRVTTQIPRNLGGGTNESELYFIDFADVVIGEATSILIDVSSEAAYHDGSNVVAAFSLDQTVIRAIIEGDINLRHAESVHVTTGVTWGV